MAQESTLTITNRLDRQIDGLLSALDVDLLGRETKQTITLIRQLSRDTRLDVRDWEMAESRTEMLANAAAAKQRIEDLRKKLLKASEYGIFGTITIVDLSAQLDAILADLE